MIIRFKKEVYFYCTEQKHKRPKYVNYFTISDLEGFIGIYLYFGVVKLRNTKDYWNLGHRSDRSIENFVNPELTRPQSSTEPYKI
jgi:hypothetical protein